MDELPHMGGHQGHDRRCQGPGRTPPAAADLGVDRTPEAGAQVRILPGAPRLTWYYHTESCRLRPEQACVHAVQSFARDLAVHGSRSIRGDMVRPQGAVLLTLSGCGGYAASRPDRGLFRSAVAEGRCTAMLTQKDGTGPPSERAGGLTAEPGVTRRPAMRVPLTVNDFLYRAETVSADAVARRRRAGPAGGPGADHDLRRPAHSHPSAGRPGWTRSASASVSGSPW